MFSVADSDTAADLGLDHAAEQRTVGGNEIFVIEKSFVTLGDTVASIESAAGPALTGTATRAVVVDDPDSAADNATLTDDSADFTPGILVGRRVDLLETPGESTCREPANRLQRCHHPVPRCRLDGYVRRDYEISGAGLSLPATNSFSTLGL